MNGGMFGQIVDNAFMEADTDKSGFIEMNELTVVIAKIHKQLDLPYPSQEVMNEYLKQFDTNKDGKISKEEFVKVVQLMIGAEKVKMEK